MTMIDTHLMRDFGHSNKPLWLRIAAVAAFGFVLTTSDFFAQTPPSAPVQDATATELLTAGYTAYGAGKFEESIGAYQKFITDFGKSAEAAVALPQILPLLALSQIRLEKWADATDTIQLFLTKHAGKAPPSSVEDMKFWEGVSLLKQDNGEDARGKLEAYIAAYPKSPRLGEARIMVGMTYLQAEDYKASAEHFAKIKNLLSATQRTRAVLLELYSRVENDQNDESLRLVVEEYPKLANNTQIAGFELLALQLGANFLADGEYRKAIAALQRIWSSDRIIKHSEDMLEKLAKQLADADQRHLDATTILQFTQTIRKVQSDLESMKKVPNFDSSLRLRLASAYLGMKRYREGAIIMDQMLSEMTPDAVVEKASVNLVQCWAQIARWPKAIEAADTFAATFPKSAELPRVLFLKGQSLSADQKYPEAIAVFDDVINRFPRAELAARCFFMKGYTQLVNQENEVGIATLVSFSEKYPKDELSDTAYYWRGMGYSLGGQHEKAREVLADYLKKNPSGQHVSEARFRRAYDAQSMKKYDVSTKELQTFLKDYPKDPAANDARLLLGDALMAQAKVDEGITILSQITPNEQGFYEQGYFKIAKALRLQEKLTLLREHLQKFLVEYPKSNRIAEAAYMIGKSWSEAGEVEKARDIYWQAIQEMGNDAEAQAVEDLLTGVSKLYKGEEQKAQLVVRFQDLEAEASANQQKVLVARTLWAQALIVKKSNPAISDTYLLKAVPLIDVRVLNPQLLADFADALQRTGKTSEAVALYRDLVKWNPRAVQRDRAFAALGQIALAAGQEKEALEYFVRFDKETFGSPISGEIMLTKATLEKKRGLVTDALSTLEKILANKFTGSKNKAAALCDIGDILLAKGDAAKAVPYYQKIYVMYGRWTDFVARAYLGSGAAFEKLKDRDAAINTYNEMVSRPELAETKELVEAQTRLAKLEAGA